MGYTFIVIRNYAQGAYQGLKGSKIDFFIFKALKSLNFGQILYFKS